MEEKLIKRITEIVSNEADAKNIYNNIVEFVTINSKRNNITLNGNEYKRLLIEKTREVCKIIKDNKGIKMKLEKVPHSYFTDFDKQRWKQYKKEVELLYRENMSELEKANMDVSLEDKTSNIECPKCKQKTVSYTQVQTRSADESMTVFYSCVNDKCLFKWKE